MIMALVVFVGSQMPDGRLHVVFCDVGQGDASLVVMGDFQVLVDGGPNGEGVLSCLAKHIPFWDRKIEMVVNSHPEKDHLVGLLEVRKRYEVGRYIDPQNVENGDVLRYRNIEMDILWPKEKVDENVLGASTSVNKYAVVMELKYQGFKVLYTGDISSEEEQFIEGSDIDVLKVAHHGSKFSTTRSWLEKLDPEIGVISVGKNSYGHPTNEVLSNLQSEGVKTYRTDRDGEVEVIVNYDGEYVLRNKKSP